jgi:DNA phosphorothioation-dependent restriction protein DptG
MSNNKVIKKVESKLTTLASFAREVGVNKSKLQFYFRLGLIGEPEEAAGDSKVMIFNRKKLESAYSKIVASKKTGKKLNEI